MQPRYKINIFYKNHAWVANILDRSKPIFEIKAPNKKDASREAYTRLADILIEELEIAGVKDLEDEWRA